MEAKISQISSTEEQNTKNDQPLFASRTAAGFGVPGDDVVDESLNLHDFLVKNETATFFVQVTGDSMEGAKIFDGDVLVVDRSVQPSHGRIVVAAVNGELVVKRLSEQAGEVLLLSENDAYKPIRLEKNEDCYIWGVVTGSARKIS